MLVPLPLETPLDYLLPDGMKAETGDYVVVPVAGRNEVGVVWDSASGNEYKSLKRVRTRLDLPPMPPAMRAFLSRAAEYTLTPPGMMLRLATRVPGLQEPETQIIAYRSAEQWPERMSAARQRVADLFARKEGASLSAADIMQRAEVSRAVLSGLVEAGALLAVRMSKEANLLPLAANHAPPILNPEQETAASVLRDAVGARTFRTLLLHGVTGSGKTETYMEAIAEALRQNRQALVLLPEIALTSEFLRRIERRFGAVPAEWHSGMTGVQRRRVWKAVAEGKAQLVAGARSALFLPFTDLGLIVVDEEHEPAYKQEDGVLYQARDMAVLRASLARAPCVLASATPSLESWVNAEAGKYTRLTLTKRHGKAELPRITAVNLTEEPPERGAWLSRRLNEAIAQTLVRREQTLLFLNRRGYAPLTLCRKCGYRFACTGCDAWLVEHRRHGRMICHQCGYFEPSPATCPSCDDKEQLVACGPGVERVAEEVKARFPTARLSILSSDLLPDAGALRAELQRIAEGEADIIIGTQLVAKGHNFPLLTTVGVVDADLGLQGGDLRAAERTFQILSQVAGRAGRAERPGTAYMQTTAPEHPALRAILHGDAEGFRKAEAAMRQQAGQPPFGRLVAVIVSGKDEGKTRQVAQSLAREAEPVLRAGADVFGPAPAPFATLRGRHRIRLLAKFPRNVLPQVATREWRARVKAPSGVRVVFDVDPYSFL